MAVPNFCRVVKTVPIPFEYSPYLSDNSFGLGLTWGSVGNQETGCFTMAHVKGKFHFPLISSPFFSFSFTFFFQSFSFL